MYLIVFLRMSSSPSVIRMFLFPLNAFLMFSFYGVFCPVALSNSAEKRRLFVQACTNTQQTSSEFGSPTLQMALIYMVKFRRNAFCEPFFCLITCKIGYFSLYIRQKHGCESLYKNSGFFVRNQPTLHNAASFIICLQA